MPPETIIHLTPEQFSERERPLASFDVLKASTFRYSSGVAALKLESDFGQLILLPFQGQQVWSASFGTPGMEPRTLTMRSMFDEPQPTRSFLDTFGGFIQHCGITAVGGPSTEDDHPLHGELPNAPYQSAYLVTGEDDRGRYIGMGGAYRHTVAFAHNYVAEPLVKLYAGSTLFNLSMAVTNLKRSEMELFYLAHVNFRPVDNGRVLYSAPSTPQHVRVRTSIPSHIKPGPGYKEFIARLREEPELHETLAPDLPFDPEIVFFINYLADAEGWAHSMQLHPDGSADYIRHRPEELPKGTRWISRTPDQDAIALVEAGTSEPEGYLAEKAKGNARALGPGETFHASLDIGLLAPSDARQMAAHIAGVTEGTR